MSPETASTAGAGTPAPTKARSISASASAVAPALAIAVRPVTSCSRTTSDRSPPPERSARPNIFPEEGCGAFCVEHVRFSSVSRSPCAPGSHPTRSGRTRPRRRNRDRRPPRLPSPVRGRGVATALRSRARDEGPPDRASSLGRARRYDRSCGNPRAEPAARVGRRCRSHWKAPPPARACQAVLQHARLPCRRSRCRSRSIRRAAASRSAPSARGDLQMLPRQTNSTEGRSLIAVILQFPGQARSVNGQLPARRSPAATCAASVEGLARSRGAGLVYGSLPIALQRTTPCPDVREPR